MIIKLQQIEKLLKEVGQKRKKRANALMSRPNKGRRSSNASTVQNFQIQNALSRPDSKQVINEADEDANSDNSD